MAEEKMPTVLVTGFGEFLDVKINPSQEIASRLPRTLPGIRVITPPSPLKAAYHPLLSVRQHLDEYNPDLVIHIGLAADRDCFAIEKSAEKEGYHQVPDEERKVFTKAETKTEWGKSPASLTTTLDTEDILVKWKSNAKAAMMARKGKKPAKEFDLRVSDDVGYYVCGFVYYVSLEWFWKKEGEKRGRPVLFLHVPTLKGEDELEMGKRLTVALIQGVVESCGL